VEALKEEEGNGTSSRKRRKGSRLEEARSLTPPLLSLSSCVHPEQTDERRVRTCTLINNNNLFYTDEDRQLGALGFILAGREPR
jgi:hypothetical protein